MWLTYRFFRVCDYILVVGFTSTYPITAYHHYRLWFYLVSMLSTLGWVIAEIWAWKQTMSRTTRGLRLQMYVLRPNYFYSLFVSFESLPLISCNLPRLHPIFGHPLRLYPHYPVISWPPPIPHTPFGPNQKLTLLEYLYFSLYFSMQRSVFFLACYRHVNKKWRG